MNSEEKIDFVKKAIALSDHTRDEFATLTELTPSTFRSKLYSGASSFSSDDISKIKKQAKREQIWNEFGFRLVTSDIACIWEKVIDYADIPVKTASIKMDIPISRLYRYYRKTSITVNNDDIIKLLHFSKMIRLEIEIRL